MTLTLTLRQRALVYLLLYPVLASLFFIVLFENARAKDGISVADYFALKRVTALTLSSDGAIMAYAVTGAAYKDDKYVSTIYARQTYPGAAAIPLEPLNGASNFTFVPGTHDIAYLKVKDDLAQIFIFNLRTEKTSQLTDGNHSVTSFKFSPDGAQLAYVTQEPAKRWVSTYDQLFKGKGGVLIDTETIMMYNFLPSNPPYDSFRPANQLWLKNNTGIVAVNVPGQTKSFNWSPSGTKLSIGYINADMPTTRQAKAYASVAIYDIRTNDFNVLFEAKPDTKAEDAVYYGGGQWISERRIFVRRSVRYGLGRHRHKWAIADTATSKALSWHETDTPTEAEIVVKSLSCLLINQTANAVEALYELSPDGVRRADFLQDLPGAAKFFFFSSDFKSGVFVHESITIPPEIYLWRNGQGLQKITTLNNSVTENISSTWRELKWKSKDGNVVQGWLIEPASIKGNAGPYPLMTFVHGGPSSPYKNEFALNMASYGGGWPHMFLNYVEKGMAVFLPNYRGTGSFGYEYRTPETYYGKPADDIATGIDYLVAQGIADHKRLAIAGHSHGSWLGALVMVREKRFLAGSFAEGLLNTILNYQLLPDWVNREGHDLHFGIGLYDNPELYINISPELHFEGLDTAVLFEAGATSLGLGMMSSPKAAKRAGLPTEFVVYAQTGHTIQTPQLQKESATRNLDWFRFWLQGYEDPDREKQEQYARWRKMRDEQCVQLEDQDNAPWYCRR